VKASAGDQLTVLADGVAVHDWPVSRTLATGRGPLTWPRRTWSLELASVVAFDALYESVRALAPARHVLAFFNAAKIMDAEARTHLNVELGLNRALTAHPLLGTLSGYYYSSLFFALTPAMLAWLWARRPDSYAQLRSALVLSTLVALLGYWVFPVAPPRFALGVQPTRW
jgi:hypothetical protein